LQNQKKFLKKNRPTQLENRLGFQKKKKKSKQTVELGVVCLLSLTRIATESFKTTLPRKLGFFLFFCRQENDG
jgi:hypothetical protein